MSEISNTSDIVSINGYDVKERIGVGSYGRVYKVTKNKKLYVLKEIPLNLSSAVEKINSVQNEADILSSLNNKYVVKFYESFEKNQNIYIVMEYCDNGDLCTYLHRKQKKRKNENCYLDSQLVWKLFIQMSIGLYYIHSKKIIHRDIKTLNIFLTKNLDAKIGDLGVAKILENTNHALTFIGTPYYVSPEMCRNKPYNEKSDIWALGCILYELLTYNHPFTATNQAALFIKILNNKYNPFPPGINEDLKNMVDFILQKDYEIRPSMKDIITKESFQVNAKKLGLYQDLIDVLGVDALPLMKLKQELNDSFVNNNRNNNTSDKKNEYYNNDTNSTNKKSSHTFIIQLTNSKNKKDGIKNQKTNLINSKSLNIILKKYLFIKNKKITKINDRKNFYLSKNNHSHQKLKNEFSRINNSRSKRTKSDINCLEQNKSNNNSNNLIKKNAFENLKKSKNIINPKFIIHTKSNINPRRTKFIFNHKKKLNDISESNLLKNNNSRYNSKNDHLKFDISAYNINPKNKNNIKYSVSSRNKIKKNPEIIKKSPNKNCILKTEFQSKKYKIIKNDIYKNKKEIAINFTDKKKPKNDIIPESQFLLELQNAIKNSTYRITLNDLYNHNFNLEDSKNLNTTSATTLLGKIENPLMGGYEEKYDLIMKNIEEETEKEKEDYLNNLCDEFTQTEMIKRAEPFLSHQIPLSNYQIKINENEKELKKINEMNKDELMKTNLFYKTQYEKYLEEIKKYRKHINLEEIKKLYQNKNILKEKEIKNIFDEVSLSLKGKLPEKKIDDIIKILYNLMNYEIKYKYSQKAIKKC